jgi:hypothetical protein
MSQAIDWTTSGASSASCKAMVPLEECPTKCARSTPTCSRNARQSAAASWERERAVSVSGWRRSGAALVAGIVQSLPLLPVHSTAYLTAMDAAVTSFL